MKKEIKIAIKSIIFIVAFGFIYAHFTQSTSESKLNKIAKYEKLSRPLDIQFMEKMRATAPDTIQLAGPEWSTDYKVCCDSANTGNFNYLSKFLKTNSNMPKKMVKFYITEFITMTKIKWDADESLRYHTLDLNRLTTRFPSNLVLTEYKPKK